MWLIKAACSIAIIVNSVAYALLMLTNTKGELPEIPPSVIIVGGAILAAGLGKDVYMNWINKKRRADDHKPPEVEDKS